MKNLNILGTVLSIAAAPLAGYVARKISEDMQSSANSREERLYKEFKYRLEDEQREIRNKEEKINRIKQDAIDQYLHEQKKLDAKKKQQEREEEMEYRNLRDMIKEIISEQE